MPTTFHPGPDEVVRVTASPEFPKRLSVGEGQKAVVYFGDSVPDATKQVDVTAGNSVEVAEPVRIVGATTVIETVLEPLATPAGVAADRNEAQGKVTESPKPKETKDDKELAEANESRPVPQAA